MSNEDIETLPEASGWSLHLPISLIGLTISVYMIAEILSAQQGGKTMRWQLGNVDKQIEITVSQQKQADELFQKMADPSKQAGELQNRYSAILGDLVDLAKDDPDALKVVQKFGIQRNDKAAAAAPAEAEAKK